MKTANATQLIIDKFSIPGHISCHEQERSHGTRHEADRSLSSRKVDDSSDNGRNDHPQELEPIEERNANE